MAQLTIIHPAGSTQNRSLGTSPVVLGRDPTCEVPLQDLSASRRHAVIRCQDNAYRLEDLGSKNGTLVNNTQAKSVVLRHGDEIMIGAVRVIFNDPGSLSADSDTASSIIVADHTPSQKATTYSANTEGLQLSQRRLEILYDLNERLTLLRDRDALLADAMDVCFEMLRFERGAIAVKPVERGPIEWPVVRNLRGAEGELTVSRTILSSALDRGERAIINDTAADLDPTVSMVQHGIRSAMCVPLLSGEDILGVIYGDRISTGTSYTKEDIDFLAGIGRLITIGLINARLLEQEQQRLHMERELSLAREIQNNLFPSALPDNDQLCVAALNEPGNLVSGDYYDLIQLDDKRVAFLVADVAGHGVAPALLMANLQAAVRVSVPTCDDLGLLLKRWNDLVYQNTEGSRFITCIAGILDPVKRVVTLASAGHYSPILIRNGEKPATLEVEPDYPLGILDDINCPSVTFSLEDGPCTLICYTDGIIEATNSDSEQFGIARTIETLQDMNDISPRPLVKKLRKAISTFCENEPQGDDITIMALNLKQ